MIYILIGFAILVIGCAVFAVKQKSRITKIEIDNQYQKQIQQLQDEIKQLEEKKLYITNEIANVQTISQLAKDKFSADLEIEEKNYEEAKNNYLNEYQTIISDCIKSIQLKIQEESKVDNKITEVENILSDIKKRIDCAVEVEKRAELEKNKKDFYRCLISDIDKEEIVKIRSIEPYLRDKEPLNKVVWKVYYEKPYTDMIGRIFGQEIKTGIYKITNLENSMCYVGQAVDIASRWKQHIKKGIGADNPGNNKLYQAMLSYGVENFMFEIVEECTPEMLNEREQYWQEFFHAKDFGYSIR